MLLFLPTVAGFGASIYLLLAIIVFVVEFKTIREKITEFRSNPVSKKNLFVWLVLLILVTSMINKLMHGIPLVSLKSYYASFMLLPILVAVSLLIFDRKLFLFLVLLTSAEGLVSVTEYLSGVRSFIIETPLNDITDYSLLYNSRVFGISANSSILAYKAMIALILIDYIPSMKRIWSWSLRIILVITLFISFGRTAIAAVIIYWILQALRVLVKNRHEIRESVSAQFVLIACVGLMIFFKPIQYQLSRGGHAAEDAFADSSINLREIPEPTTQEVKNAIPLKSGELDPMKQGIGEKLFLRASKVQSSGRKKIWINYLNFIEDNLWFGFGSDKLMFRSYSFKNQTFKLIHAHNSFLELLGSNGILISILYLLLYLVLFKWKNIIPIIAILIYSLGNYGIFWGFSYLDVIFLIFVTDQIRRNYDSA